MLFVLLSLLSFSPFFLPVLHSPPSVPFSYFSPHKQKLITFPFPFISETFSLTIRATYSMKRADVWNFYSESKSFIGFKWRMREEWWKEMKNRKTGQIRYRPFPYPWKPGTFLTHCRSIESKNIIRDFNCFSGFNLRPFPRSISPLKKRSFILIMNLVLITTLSSMKSGRSGNWEEARWSKTSFHFSRCSLDLSGLENWKKLTISNSPTPLFFTAPSLLDLSSPFRNMKWHSFIWLLSYILWYIFWISFSLLQTSMEYNEIVWWIYIMKSCVCNTRGALTLNAAPLRGRPSWTIPLLFERIKKVRGGRWKNPSLMLSLTAFHLFSEVTLGQWSGNLDRGT